MGTLHWGGVGGGLPNLDHRCIARKIYRHISTDRLKDITNTRLIHTCILNYIVLTHLLACFRIVDTCTHAIKHAAYTYTSYTHGSIQTYAQTLIRTHSIHKNAIHPRQHMRIQAYQHTRLHAYLHTCMTCMCWYILWSGTTKRDCLSFSSFLHTLDIPGVEKIRTP